MNITSQDLNRVYFAGGQSKFDKSNKDFENNVKVLYTYGARLFLSTCDRSNEESFYFQLLRYMIGIALKFTGVLS